MKMIIGSLGLMILIVAPVSADSTLDKPTNSQPEPRAVESINLSSTSGVEVQTCQSVDPLKVDLAKGMADGTIYECSLPSGKSIQASVTGKTMSNPSYRLLDGDRLIREFQPEPMARIRMVGHGLGPKLACDSHLERFYVMNGIMGYVSAYDGAGKRLWTVNLPGFVPLESVVNTEEVTLDTSWSAFEESVSRGTQLRVAGSYVVAETQTGGVGANHYYLHNSGAITGHIGPWDGVLMAVNQETLVFVQGGGPLGINYIPKYELEIKLSDDVIGSLVSHGIAWLLPRPIDREIKYNCMGRLDKEIKYWLGDSFELSSARQSKMLIERAGGESWYMELLKRSPVLAEVDSFNPISSEWRARFYQAMLNAGADVDIIRNATFKLKDSTNVIDCMPAPRRAEVPSALDDSTEGM